MTVCRALRMADTRWFAERLNEELTKRGMSYIDLARDLGVSHQAVYGWTRGISRPQFAQFQDLCDYLDWPHPAKPSPAGLTPSTNRRCPSGIDRASVLIFSQRRCPVRGVLARP
jgi:transcriptional regulator with XRE-family HTH domain